MTIQPSHPQGSLQAMQQQYGDRYRWLLLMTVMVGSVTAIMSSTIVNVAIPDLSHFFDLGQERAQWVSSSFMAASSTTMLTTPWMLTRLGYRRTYMLCMVLLLSGGVLGGLSHDYAWVLVARVMEGLATGMVQPIPAIIILRAFPQEQQGRASGLFGMGVVLAPALGPSVGGLLVDAFGWRSIFFLVVPFCLLSIFLASRFVPASAPGGQATQSGVSMDWVGLLLASLGTVSLLNAMVSWHQGGHDIALFLLLVTLCSWSTFLAWQWRLSKHPSAHQRHGPLLNLRLFAFGSFAKGCIVAFAYGAVLFGSTYLYPAYLQIGLKLSASYVGALLMPSGILMAVLIAIGGRLADHYPLHKLMATGLLILTVSFGLITLLTEQHSLTWLVALTMFGRIGMGLILPSLNLAAMRGVSRELITQGASTVAFVRMLGGALGVSICGIFLQWRMTALEQTQDAHSQPVSPLNAFNDTFLLLAGCCLVAMVVALRMRTPEPKGPERMVH